MPITPVKYLCACPPDTTITLLQKLLSNLSLAFTLISPSFSGYVANMNSCPCTELQLLQAINRLIINFILSFSGGTGGGQVGEIALVNGQQSYDIVFPVAFPVAPGTLIGGVQMVGSTGEIFTVAADKSTITTLGATLWLNAVPTAASVGSYISWIAIP